MNKQNARNFAELTAKCARLEARIEYLTAVLEQKPTHYWSLTPDRREALERLLVWAEALDADFTQLRGPGTKEDAEILAAARAALASEPHADVPGADLAYQWFRCDADGGNREPIPQATKASYTLTEEDVGRHVYRCAEEPHAGRVTCRCGLPLLLSGKWCTGGHFQSEPHADVPGAGQRGC